MFLAEVVGVGEKRDAESPCGVGVVGAGMGEDGVTLANEGFGEELTEVAETDDGDLELLGIVELEGYFGFVVEELCCVDSANRDGSLGGAVPVAGGR